jgi:hypothetical protein
LDGNIAARMSLAEGKAEVSALFRQACLTKGINKTLQLDQHGGQKGKGYPASTGNLTSADAYFGRYTTIIERGGRRIKNLTIRIHLLSRQCKEV